MTILTEYFPFRGGLNLVQPAAEIQPGELTYCKNFEHEIIGGYSWIEGYERFDGRSSPSAATYYILNYDAGTGTEIVEGNTVTGGTSGATGIAVIDAVLESGAWSSDAAGYLVLTNVVGTFQDNENLVVSTTRCVASGIAVERAASTAALDATYLDEAIERTRDQIGTVTGVSNIRGIHVYNGDVYVARDQVDTVIDDCEDLWDDVAAPTGVTIALSTDSKVGTYSNKFSYASGAAAGAIVCETIGVDLSSSVWISAWVKCSIDTSAGDFQLLIDDTADCASPTNTLNIPALKANEWTRIALAISSGPALAISLGIKYTVDVGVCDFYIDDVRDTSLSIFKSSTSGWTSIKSGLIGGGKYEFVNYNFSGHSGQEKMYGCDGRNPAFSWDGTTYTAISTGMTIDAPNHIEAHKKHLFLSFPGGSLQHSSIGVPTTWSAVTGASELAIGEQITGLRSINGQVLAVFGRNQKYVLYGSSSSNWNLVLHSSDTGAVEWSIQNMGSIRYLDDRGLTDFSATDTFGNFISNIFSHKIQPLLNNKRSLLTTSTINRSKNQYRLFFSDGSGLYCTFDRESILGITYVEFPNPVLVATSMEDKSGKEVIYFGSDTGYVYQMDKGASFDGATITGELLPAFKHSQSPRHRKQYRKAVFDIEAQDNISLDCGVVLDYGSPNRVSLGYQSVTVTGEGGGIHSPVGYLSTPADQIRTWTSRTSGTANNLNGICYSPGLWVAVGASGTILTSTDGVSWKTETSGTANQLHDVHYYSGLYVAVGDSGTILSSPDAHTWTARTSGTSSTLLVISNDGSGTWLAGGASGTITTSSNGTTWSLGTSGITSSINTALHNGGTVWIIGGVGTGDDSAYSLDGATTFTDLSNQDLYGGYVANDGTFILFQGSGLFYKSTPNAPYTFDLGFTDSTFAFNVNSAAYNGHNLAVACGNANNSNIRAYYSTDDTTWKPIWLPLDAIGIANNNDSDWIIVGNSGAIYTALASQTRQDVADGAIKLNGTGKNISLNLKSQSRTQKPFTINGAYLHFTPRRLERH